MKLFMLSMRIKSPAVLEYVSLPCLRILQHVIKPESGSKKYKVSVGVKKTKMNIYNDEAVFVYFLVQHTEGKLTMLLKLLKTTQTTVV